MRILNFYIGRILLHHTLVVFSVLLGLFMLVNFIDQLQQIGTNNYHLKQVLLYVLLSAPRSIYEIFPLVGLLGTILGLSAMAADTELVVMRASGVSLLQIVIAIMKVGSLYVLAGVLVGEFVTPISETTAQRVRSEALHSQVKQQTDFGLWLRDKQSFVNIGEVLPDLTVVRIKVFEFDDRRRLRSLVAADRGVFTAGQWSIANVRQTLLSEQRVTSQQADTARWDTDVTPGILSVFLIHPDQLSAIQLWRYIVHLRENAQQTTVYELSFWGKVIEPFSTAVMVLLAIPFVFGQARSGSTGRNLFVGIMIGLTFYVFSKGFGYLVQIYGVPPLLAAMIPTLVFGVLALLMLRRVA